MGLQEEWSPKDSIPCAQHLPVHSIREEEHVNISMGSGGHWEWSWEIHLYVNPPKLNNRQTSVRPMQNREQRADFLSSEGECTTGNSLCVMKK